MLGLVCLGWIGGWSPRALIWGGWGGGLLSLLSLAWLSHRDPPSIPLPTESSAPWTLYTLFGGLLFIVATYTALPEITFDALHYQLALPQQWLLQQSITPQSDILFSNFPPGMNALYGWALALGGEGAAKWLHMFFGVAVLIQLIRLGNHFGSRLAGWIAAVSFLAAPAVLTNWVGCQVDLPVTLFFLAALETLVSQDGPRQRAVWAGIFLGIALWIKYTAWVFTGILLLWWLIHLVWVEKQGWKASWAASGMGGGVALLIITPWVVRNLFLHGLPWYPYGAALGPGLEILLQEQEGASLTSWHAGYQWITDTLFTSHFSRERLGFQWILLILTPWLMFMRKFKLNKSLRSLGLMTVVLGITYLLFTRVVRFYFPLLALSSLWIGWILQKTGGNGRWIHHGYMALLCLQAVSLWTAKGYGGDGGPWPFLTGKIDRTTYLSQNHPEWGYPNPPYPAIQFINAHTPREAKILFVGEERVAHCLRPVIYGTAYQMPPFMYYLKSSSSSKGFQIILQSNGITHLFINRGEISRLNQAFQVYSLNPEEMKRYNSFIAQFTTLAFQDQARGLLVYTIKQP